MHFPILALLAAAATAAPTSNSTNKVASAPSCPNENAGLGTQVATFTSWITDCGDKTGHTTGLHLAYQVWNDLCFPLPDDTRALEIHDIAEGCRGKFVFIFRLLGWAVVMVGGC